MSRNNVEYLPCIGCASMGYTDERTFNGIGYICVRCAMPHIEFEKQVLGGLV